MGGVAGLVGQSPGALDAVPGVGSEELEGRDVVVLDAALDARPADQDRGDLTFGPHRCGDDRPELVGTQLGVAAGPFEVVVDDDGPALLEHQRRHAPVGAVHVLDVGVGEPRAWTTR